ncbi:MFS transporter [Chromatiaceae bacterium AAb-1]|nr:MFS transporter [Chromatiaceae bacterium AAb-1]
MQHIRSLFVFNALSMTAMMAFIPVIGPIIRQLGLAEWHAGLVVTVAGVCWMLMSRVWGKLSDRKGRKPILVIASAGYVITYLSMAVFLDIALQYPADLLLILLVLIILRGLVGVFYAAIPPVSMALIADVIPPEQRGSYMARLGAASAVGMVVGPLLGGLLARDYLILPLYVAAVLPLVGLVWLLTRLPSASANQEIAGKTALWDARLRLPALAMLLATSSVITAQMTVGFYAIDRLQLDHNGAARAAGMAMTAVGITLIVVQGTLSRFRKINSELCLTIGALIAMCGFVLAAFIHSLPGLVLAYGIMAAGLGMVFPSIQTITANAVAKTEQGTAAGTISAVQGLAMVIVPLVCTALYKISPETPYLTAAGLLLLLTVVFITRKRTPAA